MRQVLATLLVAFVGGALAYFLFAFLTLSWTWVYEVDGIKRFMFVLASIVMALVVVLIVPDEFWGEKPDDARTSILKAVQKDANLTKLIAEEIRRQEAADGTGGKK